MDITEWRNIQKNRPCPGYAHFDYRTSIDKCWNYISNPQKVATHGFYPFIHYNKRSRKISKGKKVDPKVRSIYYAAHIDSMIYKYYAYLLNELYNKWVIETGISNIVVAYRTDLKKNNINFAHEAFNFIKTVPSCYVMIGDFTNFFDTLEHRYLKQQLCSLLQVPYLPQDYYSIFKSITKFSFFDLNNILNLNGLTDNPRDRRRLNRKVRVLSPKELNSNRAMITRNPNNYGIPQGSPISAVLANIYMLTVDKEISDYLQQYHGFYMRYCDDFIIVLPEQDENEFKICYEWIKNKLGEIPNLLLQNKKTKLFYVSENTITNCAEQFMQIPSTKNIIDFLGFSYDGNVITIRDKTVSKYYYRMYRKIKTIKKCNGYTVKGQKISCKNLYMKYSRKGANEGRGNFITYVKRAQKEFGLNEAIDRSTKKHMQKISNQLKFK